VHRCRRDLRGGPLVAVSAIRDRDVAMGTFTLFSTVIARSALTFLLIAIACALIAA
jgi:hypothetical protein